MPNRIRILPDEIANRIAAGEVVERPASVVKELVENAIDAGADRIVVEVAAGGKETIRVSDNGCGMSRDDALLALERHATSKIFDLSDLRTLRTLGFRGEALPSIAAVCRMALETRLEGEVEGTRIVIEGGRIRDVTAVGRGQGTTLTVHGLFFNVPARRKFLKGVETELRHTVNAVTGLALACPEIAFVLSHNGREVFNLNRTDRERRIEAVFGVHLGRDAVFVDGSGEGVQVWGFVGRPEVARKSGAQQVLIVNGRWVAHKAMTYAIYDGYGGLLPKGLYPAFSISLEVDPARLDVNVHPSKREVRFADERTVYRTLAQAVRAALREANVIPEVAPDAFEPAGDPSGGAADLRRPWESGADRFQATPARRPEGLVAERPVEGQRQAYRLDPLGLEGGGQMALPLTIRKPAAAKVEASLEGLSEGDLVEEDAVQVSVWQLHEKYVLAHIKNGLILIDQHVAHERILYEQALDHFHASPGTGQRLLFPITIDFGLREIQAVREAIPLLEKMGFGVRDFGGNTVVVDAIPVGLKAWEDGKLLREIVADLSEKEAQPPAGGDGSISPLERRLAASYACHTSVRSGDALSTREMQALIDQLFATREPFVCPHGRPIVVKMSLDEIDQRFGR